MKKYVSLLILGLLMALGITLFPNRVAAFTPNYQQGNLIDNPTLRNNSTMSASAIQSFLSSLDSGLATYKTVEKCSTTIQDYYANCNKTVSAAQIIYDAGRAYGINPRAILATLQKEQGLVTQTNPTSSQLDYAMGYGCPDSTGCGDAYKGFFKQIDNGTWQIRFSYERARGNNTWWNSSLTYPCKDATQYYAPGLFPGNIISFKDDYGTVYKKFAISNAATATFYCYTPHAYPGSSKQYYSGSYWFVYYFQKWFGSTQTTIPFAWNLENYSIYSDAARTQRFSNRATIPPGAKMYIALQARNVGYETWDSSFMRLGTSSPRDRNSQFTNSDWISNIRAAAMEETSVIPGEVGTFLFSMTAPSQTGEYVENFNLVAEGKSWLNDLGFKITVNVVSAITARNSSNTGLGVNEILTVDHYLLSPDTQSILLLQKDGNLVLYTNFRAVWSSNTSGKTSQNLIMQSDGNLVLYDKNNVAVWYSNTHGFNNATLSLLSNGNLSLKDTGSIERWKTNTPHNPNLLGYVNTSASTTSIFPGQSLETADRKYRLDLQKDGNLVLYSPSRAIWSTKTTGKNTAFLSIQRDGNLVLYNSQIKAIWSSNTAIGKITNLRLQGDGNLVLYDPNYKAIWSSKTAGVE